MEPIKYKNFDILIQHMEGEHYPTRVLHSPAGETRGALSFSSLVPDVVTNLKSLRDLVLDNGPDAQPDVERWTQATRFGELLFDALMSDELRSCFDVSMNMVRQSEQGLRIRLRIEPPELAALPWEMMRDKRSDKFISLSVYSPVVRYIELQQATPPLVTRNPLCILVVISNPTDQQPLNAELETRHILQALDKLVQKGAVKITVLRDANLLAIQRQLRDEAYNVLHYIGHGHFGERADEGYLVFENSQGRSHFVSGRKLGPLLRDEDTLRLVMLNACSTAVTSEARPFSGVATSLVQAGIPAVVAMQTSITDTAALQFSQEFYESLADGYPLDTAVSDGRKAIEFSADHTVEWAIPQLFMRVGDGVLFDIRPQKQPPDDKVPDTQPRDAKPHDVKPVDVKPPPLPAEPREYTGLRLDIRPVTNEEFMRFVQATGAKAPSTWQRGKYQREKANDPVTGVTWHQAVAYAQWAGKRLPKADEWDNAASALDRARLQWEWTSDEVKPRGLGRQGTKRVLKGGSSTAPVQGATQTSAAWPDEQLDYIGFRCAQLS
jgi:hypothetical protein